MFIKVAKISSYKTFSILVKNVKMGTKLIYNDVTHFYHFTDLLI